MGQINARDWIFQISDEATPTPTWSEVAGLESFTLNPAENEETVDTTTFASDGIYEGQVMQRGASLALSGKAVKNGATKDPGQAQVETVAAAVGEDSLGTIRFRHISDTTNWTVWSAYVSLAEQGGGTNDKSSWGATFTKSGPATTAAVV